MIEKLNPDLDTINWQQVSDLFDKVGWEERPLDVIAKAFKRSTYTFFIFDDGNNIIAFGRTMDDGHFYALLVDIVVDPDYQGQGLGTKIVNTLQEQVKEYFFVTLTSAPGKDEFYERIGWKKQKSAFIWPYSKRQEEDHC